MKKTNAVTIKDCGGGHDIRKTEKYYNVMGIPFNEHEINKTHGIEKPFVDKNQKRKLD